MAENTENIASESILEVTHPFWNEASSHHVAYRRATPRAIIQNRTCDVDETGVTLDDDVAVWSLLKPLKYE